MSARYTDEQKKYASIDNSDGSVTSGPADTIKVMAEERGLTVGNYVAPAATWETVRGERDALLNASDWMAMSDRTITDSQASYRQTLRDIPADYADPASVVWPTIP